MAFRKLSKEEQKNEKTINYKNDLYLPSDPTDMENVDLENENFIKSNRLLAN